MKNWNEKFKEFCKDKGYSATQVSEITGLSKATIASYYQGVRVPRDENKILLSQKLGLDIAEIFYGGQ